MLTLHLALALDVHALVEVRAAVAGSWGRGGGRGPGAGALLRGLRHRHAHGPHGAAARTGRTDAAATLRALRRVACRHVVDITPSCNTQGGPHEATGRAATFQLQQPSAIR